MRIDWSSRTVRIAGSCVAFAGLVAWLVPPTTPQRMASPLTAFAGIDSHRDDAARFGAKTVAYSPATWRKWEAAQAARPPRPMLAPPPTPTHAAAHVHRPSRYRDDDRPWPEQEAWPERDDDRWAREDDRWTLADERRVRAEERRRDREEERAFERQRARDDAEYEAASDYDRGRY